MISPFRSFCAGYDTAALHVSLHEASNIVADTLPEGDPSRAIIDASKGPQPRAGSDDWARGYNKCLADNLDCVAFVDAIVAGEMARPKGKAQS